MDKKTHEQITMFQTDLYATDRKGIENKKIIKELNKITKEEHDEED